MFFRSTLVQSKLGHCQATLRHNLEPMFGRSDPFQLVQPDPLPSLLHTLDGHRVEEEQEEKEQSQNPACKSKQPSELHPTQREATLPWAGSVLKTNMKRDVKS